MKVLDALKSWPDWGLGFTREPEVVARLEGGLTNRSYLLQVGQSQWVLRINADNSKQLGIDRGVEQRVLAATSKVGLSPAIYYCSPEAGILVSQYLPTWQPASLNQIELDQLAGQMLKLHQLELTGVPEVDYADYTEGYARQIKDSGGWTSELAVLRERELPHVDSFLAERTSLPLARPALCHHDPSPSHWRLQGETLCLIDWEYAAYRDPACDLALLVDGWRLSEEQTKSLLTSYGGSISVERLAAAQRVCCYVNRLWFALQKVREY